MRFVFILFLMFSTSVSAQSYVDDYQPVTHENFAKLMWKYGAHDLNDKDISKTYFQIVNCPLFSKYYKDDFIWKTIIEGFERDIRYFSKDIPHKFYIQASLPIDRYDFERSAFIVSEEFALDNAGSIQIPFYEQASSNCEGLIDKKYFPRRIKFIADRKFALKEIPMRIDDASALLERIKNYRYEGVESNRVVSVRFLITIDGIQSYVNQEIASELKYKGSLDEIAFFEDPQMTKPIWKKQFKIFEDQSATP